MTLRKAVPIFLAAVGAAVAVAVHDDLAQRLGLPELGAVALAAVLGVCVSQLLEYLVLALPLRVRAVRRVLNPVGRIEGRWIEYIASMKDYPVCISRIVWDPGRERYLYNGHAFGADGTKRARYDSLHIAVDPTSPRTYWLAADGQFFDSDAKKMRSYGEITFEDSGFDDPTRAEGLFVHFHGSLELHKAELERDTPELRTRLFKNPAVVMPSDAELATAFLMKRLQG